MALVSEMELIRTECGDGLRGKIRHTGINCHLSHHHHRVRSGNVFSDIWLIRGLLFKIIPFRIVGTC